MKKLKYSNLKIFHFKDKIDSLPLDNPKILPPIHIRIKPTNRCNHNCYYCAYRVDNLQLGQDMKLKDEIPKDKMMKIIDDCIEMGVKAITFSGGGEPFIYKHFKETIKKLSTTNIAFASLSNGSNVKGEIAELFAHYGTWLRISMDGWDNESYSEYRKVGKEEFRKIIQNMRNFKAFNGKCSLGVSFIVDKKNYNHIYNFVHLIKDTGADSIKINGCIVDNNGVKNNAYHKPIFDYVKEEVERAKQDFEDDSFEIYDSYHYLDEEFYKNYNWCPYSQILPVIGADLNIYPCQDKAYNLENGLIGSIKNKKFKTFWFENKEKFFKINPINNCNNHCIANKKNKMILEYLNLDKNHLGFV